MRIQKHFKCWVVQVQIGHGGVLKKANNHLNKVVIYGTANLKVNSIKYVEYNPGSAGFQAGKF